jgi:hypothetical protein
MSPAHFHLILNHAPLFGLLGAMLLLLGGLLRKSSDVVRAGLLVAIVTSLIGIPAYLTGESAEESIEHVQGISHDTLEAHEDAALGVLVATELAGVLSLVGLIMGRTNDVHLRRGALLTTVVAALGFGWAAYVNNLGGQIRHPEITTGAAAQAPTAEHKAD